MSKRLPFILPFIAFVFLAILPGCAHHDADGSKNSRNNSQQGKAGDSFEAIPKDPPVKPETSFAAAQWSEQMNQLPKAAELYRQTLKADPKHEQAMYRLGIVTAKLHQYPESIEVWKRYVKLTNGSAQAYSNLAYTEDLAGLIADAVSSYEKGISRDAKSVPCRVNYGLLLARQGKRAEALAQLQAVLTEAEAHYNLGSLYEMQGKKDLAAVEYNKALELDPSLTDAKLRRAALDGPPSNVSRAD
jgi:tetratricopeptide (TPR) repeat protein